MAAGQPETRRTRIELRAGVAAGEGRQLTGTALRYGDRARFPWGEERFEPGAFGDLAGQDIILNAGHDAGRPLARTPASLTLTDTAEALRFAAALPDTRDSADTLELVRAGVLTGASIEFLARQERQAGAVRVVERASLLGIAVVARGAYPSASVDARERCGVCTGEQRGAALAAVLERAIGDGPERGGRIEAMAEAAGIEADTVAGILRAEIECPPIERLRGFAAALEGVSLRALIEAAERDGCDPGAAEDRAERRAKWWR